MEERTITAGDIARLLKRRIVWILFIALIAALAAALFTAFFYNRAREEYFLTFVVQFAEDTPFRYETVIYADNLEGAKASDGDFSAIDTVHMAADEDISIVRTGGEGEQPSYTVSACRKYFSDRAQATKFLRAVVERAVQQAENAARETARTPRLLPFFPHLQQSARLRTCSAEGTGARVMYRQNVVSVTDNGRSPVAAALFCFVLAFLAAGLVFCAVDYPKYKRSKEALSAAQTGSGENGEGDREQNASGAQ